MGNGSISLAQIGSMPHRTEARGKPEIPSNRLPIVSFLVDCVISYTPFSFDCRGDGSRHIHRGLCRINGARNIGLCCGVQTETAGDAGNFACGEHESNAHQRVVFEHHKSRNEDGGLEEGSQAQADDLPHPAHESIQIATRNAEHIEAAHRDLDEQDAPAFQVGKKHLQHRIAHKDHAKEKHNGAGDDAETKVGAVHHIRQGLDLIELRNDVLSHLTNAPTVAGKPCGKGSLQRHRQSIEPDRDNGEEAYRQKALDDIHPALLEIASAGGVFNAALKGADYHADGKQRPRKAGEKENDGADPFQFKKFHAHIAHEGKEIAEKAHDLPVDPIHQLIQNCRGNKVPNKYLRSPPKMQKAAAQMGDGLSYRVFCFASDCSAYLSSRG